MSQPAGQGYICQHPGCLVSLTPKITLGDKNGNRGRRFVSCVGSLQDPHAEFICFLDGDPTPHPTSLPQPKSQGVPQWIPETQPQASLSSQGETRCSVHGCPSRRINIKCVRNACARHCRDLGGCSVNQHQGVQGVAPLFPPQTQSSFSGLGLTPTPFLVGQPTFSTFGIANQATTQAPSIPESHPYEVSMPPVPPVHVQPTVSYNPSTSTPSIWQAQTEPPTSMNPLPNPQFASQMKPVFTEQIAREHSLQESRRLEEEQRLYAIKKMKHTVHVCAWLLDNTSPEECVFQEDFVWPNFCLSASVLLDIGLGSLGEDAWFHLYNHARSSWQRVKVGHIISVLTRSEILLKAIDVKACLGIDQYLDATSQSNTPPHFRENLRGERVSVAMKVADEFLLAHPSTPRFSTPVAKQSRKTLQQGHSSPCYTTPLLLPAKRRNHDRSYPHPPILSSPLRPSMSKTPDNLIEVMESESDGDSDSDVFLTPKAGKRRKHSSVSVPSSTSQKQWPSDFYVVDVIHVFECCKFPPPHTTVAQVFESITHMPFKRSTYYDAKIRWENAKQKERDSYQEAGYSARGKWSAFANRVPLPRNKLKTARQRVQRHQRGGESDRSDTGSIVGSPPA